MISKKKLPEKGALGRNDAITTYSSFKQSFLTSSGKLTRQPAVILHPVPAPQPQPGPQHTVIYNVASRDQAVSKPKIIVADKSGTFIDYFQGRLKTYPVWEKGKIRATFLRDGNKKPVTIRGFLSVVDTGFHYHLKVRKCFDNGTKVYDILGVEENGITPLPISGSKFQQTLLRKLNISSQMATQIALVVAADFITDKTANSAGRRLESAEIPIEHIFENFKKEEWYYPLGQSWTVMKYKFFPDLLKFWKYAELQRLHLDELQALHESLTTAPMYWFLKEYTNTRLPCIDLKKSDQLLKTFKSELHPKEITIIGFYNAVCDKIAKTKCLSLTHADLIGLTVCSENERPSIIAACLSEEYKLLKRVHETCTETDPHRASKSFARYYRYQDWVDLMTIDVRLKQIMTADDTELKRSDTYHEGGLVSEQARAVSEIVNNLNVILVSGDAGTGKTRCAKAMYLTFGPNVCTATAAYGGLAARNNREFDISTNKSNGRGLTIDLILEMIRRKTQQGQKIAAFTKVLFIDEIGVVSVRHFADLLRNLPNLIKIVMTGDVKQCKPVAAGRILDGLLAAWEGSRYIVELQDNQRSEFKTLIDNFRYFVQGELDSISFSTTLLSPIPFKVLKRIHYSEDTSKRVDGMIRELRPIYTYLTRSECNMTQVRIVTHTIEDTKSLNIAWFKLMGGGKALEYEEDVYYPGDSIRFLKNYTGGHNRYTPSHIQCDAVNNNSIVQIKEIYDISPTESPKKAYETRQVRNSTSAEYSNASLIRVLEFSDGTKINVRDYPLTDITHGFASTILSTIGHECETVIVWVPPETYYFYRELLYTAMTRAKKMVILIMDIGPSMKLSDSDMLKLWKNEALPTENTLHAYIPKDLFPTRKGEMVDTLNGSIDTGYLNIFSECISKRIELDNSGKRIPNQEVDDNAPENMNAEILKFFEEQNANSRFRDDNWEDESESESKEEQEASEESGESVFNQTFFPASQTVTQDITNTLTSTQSPAVERFSPPKQKRHFAHIGEEVRQREKEKEEDKPIWQAPKRLKLHCYEVIPEWVRADIISDDESEESNGSEEEQSDEIRQVKEIINIPDEEVSLLELLELEEKTSPDAPIVQQPKRLKRTSVVDNDDDVIEVLQGGW